AGGIRGLLARSDHTTISPTHAFYHADDNGNITAMVNDKQLIVARYEYDPFGNILSKSGPVADANTYLFSSQEYHQPSGLLLYLYRAYDPNLQRFGKGSVLNIDTGLVVVNVGAGRASCESNIRGDPSRDESRASEGADLQGKGESQTVSGHLGRALRQDARLDEHEIGRAHV